MRNNKQWVTFSGGKSAGIIQQIEEGCWKIKKATDIGAFVVSPNATIILKELRDRPKLEWDENPSWEIYQQDYEYYKDALNKIVQVAKEDLKANKA